MARHLANECYFSFDAFKVRNVSFFSLAVDLWWLILSVFVVAKAHFPSVPAIYY